MTKQTSRKKVVDVNVPRKGGFIRQHIETDNKDETAVPVYSLIEFNLSGLCNRTCVFCPRVDSKVFPNKNEHLSVDLYEKIMSELRDIDYEGMILFSGFGEPLLHKNVELLISMTKRYCPRVRLEMVTNGDRLTLDRLRSVFDCGLDALLVSMYDGPEQREQFDALRKEAGLSVDQVVLRDRWLPPEESYGIALTNRGGLVEIDEVGVHSLKEPIKRQCYYPFYMVMVDHDGSVLLCTHDWGKKLIVGNLRDKTISELWNSPLMKRVRTNLGNADRSFPPCNVCDVDGTVMGKNHFDKWHDYYEQSEPVHASQAD